jgi:hypothetical protein
MMPKIQGNNSSKMENSLYLEIQNLLKESIFIEYFVAVS